MSKPRSAGNTARTPRDNIRIVAPIGFGAAAI
jgi:hypothetical protein